MFYSHELLGYRRGKYSTIWLLATAGPQCKWRHISNKDIANVDIPRACADLVQPDTFISLRLASVLLSGLVQVLAKKFSLLHSECNCTCSRMVSLPWITSRQRYNPFISSNTIVSSAHQITLPYANKEIECSALLDNGNLVIEQIVADAIGKLAGDSGCLKVWHSFGWSGTKTLPLTDHSSNADNTSENNTQRWQSISLPETQLRQRNAVNSENIFSNRRSSLLAKENGNTLCLGNSNESPEIQGASPPMYEDDNDILFDSSGDLHFILPRVSKVQSHTTDEDMQTVLYPASSPGMLTHNIRTSISDPEQPPLYARKEDVSDAQLVATNPSTSSGDGKSRKAEMLGMASTNVANIIPGGSSPISLPAVSKSDSEALLEIVENAIMQTLPPVVQTSPLASSRFASSSARPRPDRMRHDSQVNSHVFGPSNTHSLDITSLWGSSCVWDDERLLYTKAGVLTKVCAQKLVANRAAVASRMYTNNSVDVAARLFIVLCKDTFPSEQSYLSGDNTVPSPDIDGYKKISYENTDNNSLSGSIGALDEEEDIEVELGRGASDPIEPERPIQDADILDLHTDIPWLNPSIMQSMDPRKPASLPMSVRTESSPDIGMRHSIGESCSNSPSMSAAPFPDLPIQDEQIEIQQFLLAADCLVNKDSSSSSSRGSIASDMDSFLGPERVSNSLHQELSIEVIDVELQNFQRFMVVRMKECGKSAITFSNVLTDPFKTRRAAARAFVDILQMATMSVFRVSQDIASREISISLI